MGSSGYVGMILEWKKIEEAVSANNPNSAYMNSIDVLRNNVCEY
jgi:hypothetical protein